VHKPETYDAGFWPNTHIELEAVALVPAKDEADG
jgi:hypothetical protein